VKQVFTKMIREDNFLSLAGNLSIALFGLAVFALLARSLQPAVFGEWVIFVAAGSFVDMFRFGITNTGLIRYLSGAAGADRSAWLGANACISIAVTIAVACIIALINLLFHTSLQASGYGLFFAWYPLLAIVGLPWNTALVVLQADNQYSKILLLKAVSSGLFFMAVLVHVAWMPMSLPQLAKVMVGIQLATSIISLLNNWDGLVLAGKSTRQSVVALLRFGQYTTFTLVGTNLLRSADTFIIGLSPLGSAAVALYSIPLKLTELQQIPLRSFTATAFPKLSKASLQNNTAAVKDLFYTYAGALTYLFLLFGLLNYCFAEIFVAILGGGQYLHTDAATGFNVVLVVRVLAFYGLLIPIDRMTGIGLDSINKPNVNARKVFLMVTANIIGDLIAVFVFRSLVLVAVGSILFTILGIVVGMYFLNKELSLSYKQIFVRGAAFYSQLYQKLIITRNTKTINA
jgi:O-antigen/teichoic acid export membrane protein